jgi:hypothetical protein
MVSYSTLLGILALDLRVSALMIPTRRSSSSDLSTLSAATALIETFPPFIAPEPPLCEPQPRTDEVQRKIISAGATYESIHFSGCGFMLPYHFGVAKALKEAKVKVKTATASSGGVMAALAMLGGADIDIGIRQCFDLRLEPSTLPWAVFSDFFKVYRVYFQHFRSSKYKEALPLSALNEKLVVRLGRWTGNFSQKHGDKSILPSEGNFLNRPWEVFQTSSFISETDLEDAFMSAAFVPFVTGIFPPKWRGQVALDASLVDIMHGSYGKGFQFDNPSLWPIYSSVNKSMGIAISEHSSEEADSQQPTHIMVRIKPLDVDESENPKVVTISGIFGEARDFFASIERMKIGFVHGYRTTISMLDISSLPIAEKERLLQSAANADNMLDNILQKHSGWKSQNSRATENLKRSKTNQL